MDFAKQAELQRLRLEELRLKAQIDQQARAAELREAEAQRLARMEEREADRERRQEQRDHEFRMMMAQFMVMNQSARASAPISPAAFMSSLTNVSPPARASSFSSSSSSSSDFDVEASLSDMEHQ